MKRELRADKNNQSNPVQDNNDNDNKEDNSNNQVESLQGELEACKQERDKFWQELLISQEKRTGHWDKLVYEQKRNKILTKKLNKVQNSFAYQVLSVLLYPFSFKKNNKRTALQEHVNPLSSANDTSSAHLIKQSAINTVNLSAESTLKVINWPIHRYYSDIRMLSVLDEFSSTCIGKQCRMITPRPDNWKELTKLEQPHMLFVESAWQGNEGSWQYRVGTYASPPGNELKEMVAYYKEKEIPTIFWNKEDPVHYDKFIKAAKQFDVILTTDANSINKYKHEALSAQIYALPFAAEISLQNPIDSSSRVNKVCFAGSFYANRFEDRKKDQLMLLDAARAFDLDIYDRNYQADAETAKDFQFPERFTENIIGKLSYDEVIGAYKKYKVFLNVNSVIDSPTMLSRRVYELLACGTPIVSTRSKAIETQFGDELVWMVDTEEEAKAAIKTLLTDEKEWKRRSIQGIRHIMRNHTYDHRFKEIAHYAGLDQGLFVNDNEATLIIAVVKNESDYQSLLWSFNRQSWKDLQLLVIDSNGIVKTKENNVSVIENSEQLKEKVNALKSLSPLHYLARWDSHWLYGEHYIEDMIYAARYSQAELIVKATNDTDTYCFDANIRSNQLLVNTAFLKSMHASYRDLVDSDNQLVSKVAKQGGRVFVTDDMNYGEWDYGEWNGEITPNSFDESAKQFEV